MRLAIRVWLVFVMAVCLGGTHALAIAHLWVVEEVFSDATGTIQFVELYNCCAPGETAIAGRRVRSVTTGLASVPFESDLPPGSSMNRRLLIGTAGFAALPGAPALDAMLPDHFLSLGADLIEWSIYDDYSLSYASGELPTDGMNSLSQGGIVGLNSPTNYAGVTGFVDASFKPPAVPNGEVGVPMTVGPLDGAGRFDVFWDTILCANPGTYSILWGQGTDFPPSPTGTFGLSGSICSIGNTSPFLWVGSPSATDGSGLVWWLIVARDGEVEGPWGTSDGITERDGPGIDGSSQQCFVFSKELSNTCGQ